MQEEALAAWELCTESEKHLAYTPQRERGLLMVATEVAEGAGDDDEGADSSDEETDGGLLPAAGLWWSHGERGEA